MRYGEKVKPEMVETIKRLYLAKVSTHEIVKITGLSLYRVRCICYNESERLPRQKNNPYGKISKKSKKDLAREMKALESIPAKTKERILVLTNFGYSVGEISEDVQLQTSCVAKVVRHLTDSNKVRKLV